METLPTISLEFGWKCLYVGNDADAKYRIVVPLPVDSLSGWSSTMPADSNHTAHLLHFFQLQPTDICVRYQLHVEAAPEMVRLEINGKHVGDIDGTQPFILDVTDEVRLEDNALVFQVDCAAQGKFGAVYLQAVPCE